MRARSTAQETYDNARRPASAAPPLSAALRSACEAIGQQLPERWNPDLVAPSQKKALVRCLMDQVVIQRRQRDTVATRIVGKGGEVTAMALPIAVGSWRALSNSAELEQHMLEMPHQGLDDETIAQRLTAPGDRSPLHPTQLLPSTVKGIRRKHRVLVTRSQSPSRRMAGSLTIPQTAAALGSSPSWFYDRMKKGVIEINRDPSTGLSLFPDTPATLAQCRNLHAGHLNPRSFQRRSDHEAPAEIKGMQWLRKPGRACNG